jgi:signal transduction histidine kinase
MLTDLARWVVETSGALACAIFVTAADLTDARLLGMHGLPDQYARELEAAMRQGKLTFSLADLDARQPLVRHNVWQTYLNRPVLAHLQRFRTEVGWDMTVLVPLVTRERKCGVLATYYHHDQEPERDERAFLAAVGNQAAVAVENARLFVAAQQQASLEERSRLARDLHDSATQTVFSMGLLAQSARRQYDRGSDQVGATLDRVAALAQQAHAELRALLLELRPDEAVTHGLNTALARLLSVMRLRSGLWIDLHGESSTPLRDDQARAVFRLVQEALNNALKHAHATAVTVTLAERAEGLQVTVQDNGKGFEVAAVVAQGLGGMGIRSMQERAEGAGIHLEITSAPGAGTLVHVCVPPNA